MANSSQLSLPIIIPSSLIIFSTAVAENMDSNPSKIFEDAVRW